MPRVTLPEDPVERAAKLAKLLLPLLQDLTMDPKAVGDRQRYRELVGEQEVFHLQLNSVWLMSERTYKDHRDGAVKQKRLS